ncbi:MAG TPA: hypothetical protein VJ717_06035 [Gemmatimonadaceae bacterium]|nr:hypothetical protein [Gemmatimonadaceae bacterium]
MHVDLIDTLRCPNDPDSPLVAGAARQLERRILAGTLGCPVCGAEYRIANGVADFRHENGRERGARSEGRGASHEAGRATDEAAIRLAAQLDLVEPGRRILLCGSYAALAAPLTVMFDALCLTCGAAPGLEQHIAAHATVIRVDTVLPLASSSLQGIAVDSEHAARFGMEQLEHVLRPRGRLVASAHTPTPPTMDVLARDDLEWVAERTTQVVPLRRAAR